MVAAAVSATRDLIELTANGELDIHPHPGQWRALQSTKRNVVVLAGTQSGKALALDTLIPTTRGMVAMGDIRVGDTVYSETGAPTHVTYVSPIFHDRQCFEITFDDGAKVVCDAEHLWHTRTGKDREFKRSGRVSTTLELIDNLMKGDHRNHTIDLAEAFDAPESVLPIPAYTLGAWLGDGYSSSAMICSADPEILVEIQRDGFAVGDPKECNGGTARAYRVGGTSLRGGNDRGSGTLQATLRREGLLNNKHIPESYLVASKGQRLSLLQGLMDTDGYASSGGDCEFVSAHELFARSVWRLACSLGIKAHFAGADRKWRVTFSTCIPVFRLARKLDRLPARLRKDAERRYIASIDPVESVPVRCIAVDCPSHLYLCTEACIATHNTSFGPIWLWQEMIAKGPGDYLVTTPTFPLLEVKALPEFRRLFETYLKLGTYQGSPVRKFTLSEAGERKLWGEKQATPTNVYFGYAADPESLESMTAKAAWNDEAGQKSYKRGSFEAIQRRLSIHEGRQLFTTTPYDLGWLKQTFHDPWVAANGNHPTIDIINFPSTANPRFPQAELERAKRDLPRWKYEMFYLGRFQRPAGLIYDCFDPAVHIVDDFEIDPAWPRYQGADFGGVNTAGIWIAQDPTTKRNYVYAEYLAGGRTAKQHATAWEGKHGRPLKVVGGSHSEGQWRQEFRYAGYPISEPDVKEVEVGINRVYGAIQRNELFVFRSCAGLIDQINTYSRVLDTNGDPTEAIEDKASFHYLDATRYLASWLYRTPKKVRIL